MDADRGRTARLNRLIWISIAAVAAFVAGACALGPFELAWASFARAAAAGAGLALSGRYYRTRRQEPGLALALTSTAQMIAFALVAAPLSYIAASPSLPLWDDTFAAWDRWLGFDWMALLAAMNAHPVLHRLCALAYASFPIQVTTIILVLAWAGQSARLQTFLLAFIATTLVTIAGSAVVPAQGVWGHLGLSQADYPAISPITQTLHLPIFHGLRDGSLRILSGSEAEGIITFPSLHAALGLLFILAMWRVRYLRWAALVVNLLMIAATPIDGGHYFSDVIAGLAIAAACWACIARAIRRKGETELILLTPADAPLLAPDQPPVAAASERSREIARSPAVKARGNDCPITQK